MIRIFTAHPSLLMRAYPALREAHNARRISIAAFDAHRGYIMLDDQVILISPRAVLHTQIITPSMYHDYSTLGSYAHAHCKHVAYITSFPLHVRPEHATSTGATP